MEKNLIKYRIKKLQFIETEWFPTNPCLEILLPRSVETVRITPNFDSNSLYGAVLPTLNNGVIGDVNSIYQQFHSRGPSWRDYLIGDYQYNIDPMLYNDEQPF